MPTKVPIEIFPIARTQVDRAEVRRWLDHVGVSQDFEIPEDGGISNPALLIALAAKRCYRSFEVSDKLNPNVARVRKDYGEYLDNVLSSGHGSVTEHSVYTFAFEGVSRVFTGEMNRHRAGWSISEGSMRFIRYGESIPYWEADSLQGPEIYSERGLERELDWFVRDCPPDAVHDLTVDHKKHLTRHLIADAFAAQERTYRLLEKIWAAELHKDSKFSGKKSITSMMRRIIGMGVATGGVWSGNIRALRHVLTLRAAPGAEEEICHVFTRVAKYMRDTEPLLFGDFTQDKDGYWRPKYIKV